MFLIVKKYTQFASILLAVTFLLSCNLEEEFSQSPINEVNCYIGDSLCFKGEGELIISNTNSVEPITEVYITEDCDAGWGSLADSGIAPQQSRIYELEARTEYDVKLVDSTGCSFHYLIEIKPNKKETLSSNVRSPGGMLCQRSTC